MDGVSRTLYNKYRPLLDIQMKGRIVTNVNKEYEENVSFLPLILYTKRDPVDINRWFSKRLIPDNRDGLDEIRKYVSGFKYGGFFSLSDQYWIGTSPNEWDKKNFFTNRYQTDTGKLFFTPWAADEKKLKEPSPDLTTNGGLKKAWLQKDDNTSYLLKAGSRRFRQEPISEVLASMMLQKLGVINFVRYDLEIYGLKFCSKCDNFIDQDTEFVPASHIYSVEQPRQGESVTDVLVRACDRFEISNVENYILKMVAVDHIIGNTDRHLGNFGFIRDVNTGAFKGFAPLFDMGSAYTADKAAKKRVSEHFADREERATESFKKRFKKNIDVGDMLALVHAYPGLSHEEKKIVKAKILYTKRLIEEGPEIFR